MINKVRQNLIIQNHLNMTRTTCYYTLSFTQCRHHSVGPSFLILTVKFCRTSFAKSLLSGAAFHLIHQLLFIKSISYLSFICDL